MEYSTHSVSNYVIQQMLLYMGNTAVDGSSSSSSSSSSRGSNRAKVQLGEAVEEITDKDGVRTLLQVRCKENKSQGEKCVTFNS